ncbi:MAG: adenylosuccinate synthetase, partial [Candidatus Woesebacteria bacterium]|nr:adenylosuccinate synthetase [Candidatus Woesebacteria bacterium]
LARLFDAKIVAKTGVGPNAEHGLFLEDEKTYLKVNQLPLGWILNPQTQIRIGRNVAIDPIKLKGEIEMFKLEGRVKIDPNCPIITPEHIRKETESKRMRSEIGSTMSGSGYAHADHILRVGPVARDIDYLSPLLIDVSEELNRISQTETVILESSQGYGLSLSTEYYPNTTSKNITSSSAMDDVGLNPFHLNDVFLVVKTMPTREGGGSMGQVNELSTDEIKNRNLTEISSIEGKIRRKAGSIDFEMLKTASEVNGATQIVLTFCEQYDPEIRNVIKKNQVTKKIWDLIEKIQKTTDVPVTIINTGKPYYSFVYLPDTNVDLSSVHTEIDLSPLKPSSTSL